jgi:DNA polymerase III alpha subunit
MQSQLITLETQWYLPSLGLMKTDSVGQIVLNEADLINLIMQGRDLERAGGTLVNDSVDIEAASFWLEQVPNFTHWSEPDAQAVFDHMQQSTWHMPEEYRKLDIAEHVLKLCTTEAQLQRCGAELLQYQERGLFDLLRYLKYLVDVMRDNHVIWGVGRGSSVASYVLYLLGVHRINSMYYDLDLREFLR